MPKRTAITHADLAPSPQGTEFGSKTGVVLIVSTILCGLCCFILCLIAEATRSQMTWESTHKRGVENQCVYSGSGKLPLLCAATAFVGLAVAMVIEHMYMLIAISKSPPPALVSWDPNYLPVKSLTWQAGFFFVTTWICFAVGEILLLIGLSVESGHLKNWSRPRPNCLIIKQGLFSAAGVFALLAVFLAAGLYLTALRAQRISQEQEHVRREVLEASALYASPPQSPRLSIITTMARENPVRRENQLEEQQQSTWASSFASFSKRSNLV
ncbi:hypothetical protein CISIN_1g035800mg [Citrus sinensis]|uniref:Transmembrane protein n=1 Tax=Citrus sinensis TaxID=2711 RepID=A0A067FWV7_CITSI|nr:hypothetical protein CISIN_1g035800mg [Citrus sinensis]